MTQGTGEIYFLTLNFTDTGLQQVARSPVPHSTSPSVHVQSRNNTAEFSSTQIFLKSERGSFFITYMICIQFKIFCSGKTEKAIENK